MRVSDQDLNTLCDAPRDLLSLSFHTRERTNESIYFLGYGNLSETLRTKYLAHSVWHVAEAQ